MGSSPTRPADSVADLASPHHNFFVGKVAIVTGPTNGIGYETARILAKHGAHVVLAARNAKRTLETKQKLIDEIKAELPSATPQFSIVNLDLSSLSSVRSAANEFLSFGFPLHILINNAGIFTLNGTYSTTENGYESHVGSNHLGHYYFTRLLLPKLRESSTVDFPSRIINISSTLHNPKLNNIQDIENSFLNADKNYSEFQAYNTSKLYNIYHAQHLAQSEAANNIWAYSLHPGLVATNITSSASFIKRVIMKLIGATAAKTPNGGAATTIHCVMKENQTTTGQYFDEQKVTQPKPIALNVEMRQKLIELSEKFINEFEAKVPLEKK